MSSVSFNPSRAQESKVVVGSCFSSRPEKSFSRHAEALSPCDQSGATALRVAAHCAAKALSPRHVQLRSECEAALLLQRFHSKTLSPGPLRPQSGTEAGGVVPKVSPRASFRPSPRPSSSASPSASPKASPMLSPRASLRVTPDGTSPFPTLLPRRGGGEMPMPCSSALFPAQALTRRKDPSAFAWTGLEEVSASLVPQSSSPFLGSRIKVQQSSGEHQPGCRQQHAQQECAAVKCPRRRVSFGAVEVLEVESWKSETSGASHGSMLECDCCEKFFPRSGKGKDRSIQCLEKTTWLCSSCLQKVKVLKQTSQFCGVALSECIRLTKLQAAKILPHYGEIDLQSGLLHSVKPLPHHLKVEIDMQPQSSETLPKPKTRQFDERDNAQQPRQRSPQPHGSIEKARHCSHSEKMRCVPSTCQATAQAVADAGAARKKKSHYHQHPSLCGFRVLEIFTGQSS
eukprot:TRINITY_DN20499_c0_g1_i2.p1 TRINITY_DN20499_c0_g1~~TRINITY_DN20499_c0_g1_i2.p1  ORF type:complete len:473 (-),score=82.52 TRINITY_DN20499_c0_g1_i2:37-1407(-)